MDGAFGHSSRLRTTGCRRLHDRRAVHLAQGVGDELDALAVGSLEVERRPTLLVDGHARVAELGPEVLPALGLDRDGQVVEATEPLGVGAEVEAGEVEEGERVAVADVEEEVGRALVVAILEDLGQRELEEVLVEARSSARRQR